MWFWFFREDKKTPIKLASSAERWAMFRKIDSVIQPHIERLDKSPKQGWLGSGKGKAANIKIALVRLYFALLLKDEQEKKWSPDLGDYWRKVQTEELGRYCCPVWKLNYVEVEQADFSSFEGMLNAKFSGWHNSTPTTYEFGQYYDGKTEGWDGSKRASLSETLNIPRTGLAYSGESTAVADSDYWTSWYGKTGTLVAVEKELFQSTICSIDTRENSLKYG